MIETHFHATRFRRNVVIDIETVSADPNVPKGALDGLSCQIICIGMMFDDGVQLTELAIAGEQEANLLTEFWANVHATDVLIGHNALEFDLLILKQRSWVHGVRPSRSLDLRRYYAVDTKDTMTMWSNWGFKKGISLDALATALGCGQKLAHGVDVANLWAIRDVRGISEYCLQDCWLTYQIFCKLTYQEPLIRSAQAQLNVKTQDPALRRTRKRFSRSSLSSPDAA